MAQPAPAPEPQPEPAPAAMRPPPSLTNTPTMPQLVKAIQADWYEAVRLLQNLPALAQQMDEYGSFALHFAAMHRASPEVVTLLLRLNPGAAKLFNKSKYLPIHYAAGNGAPPEGVALIWHAHPAGAEQRNGKGENALELATQQNRTENMALLQDPERMKAMAAELESHTIGRANQLTYTVVNEMNDVSPQVNAFLPGTSSLVEQLGAKILVCLRDGKTLIGELQSFDQFGNLVLSRTVERIIVDKVYADKSVGTYILRGENVVLLGEIDPDKEAAGGLKRVSDAEIDKAVAAHKEANPLGSKLDWSFLIDD